MVWTGINNTVNVYWAGGTFPNGLELAEQMVLDMGFPRPSREDNAFNSKAMVLYTTYSWDSDAIEHVSFAQAGPAEAIPLYWDPAILAFANTVPLQGPARVFTFNTCYGHNIPNYYKLEADYRTTFAATIGPVVETNIKVARVYGFKPAAAAD